MVTKHWNEDCAQEPPRLGNKCCNIIVVRGRTEKAETEPKVNLVLKRRERI